MGHMDNVRDDNERTFTVRVRFQIGDATDQVFNRCTEVDEDSESTLTFTDRNGKYNSFRGVSYHVQEE